jgi:hypothetical protein
VPPWNLDSGATPGVFHLDLDEQTKASPLISEHGLDWSTDLGRANRLAKQSEAVLEMVQGHCEGVKGQGDPELGIGVRS